MTARRDRDLLARKAEIDRRNTDNADAARLRALDRRRARGAAQDHRRRTSQATPPATLQPNDRRKAAGWVPPAGFRPALTRDACRRPVYAPALTPPEQGSTHVHENTRRMADGPARHRAEQQAVGHRRRSPTRCRVLRAYGINTTHRQAHFLPQLRRTRCDHFKTTTEIRERRALPRAARISATVSEGDGRASSRGAALIQLTGRCNYARRHALGHDFWRIRGGRAVSGGAAEV